MCFKVITFVFFRLMFSPICCANLLTQDVFSCICSVWETSAKSSAKSRSSSVVNSVHLMPLESRLIFGCL